MNRAVTPRAVGIGIAFALFFCAVTPYNDFKVAATYISGTQFPLGALFVLFVFASAVNGLLRRLAPRAVFTRGELLTIWTLVLVTSGLPSSGMMRYFLPEVVAHRYLSNDANGWERKVWSEAPAWTTFADKAAAEAFADGYPRGQEHIPWEAWVGPLLAWGTPALLFLVATFCLTALLRRQWVENEKFSFPLVTLPLLLAEEPAPGRTANELLRHPLLWLGVGLTTALHTVKGLHQLYPTVPEILTSWTLSDFMTVRPWNQLGWIAVILYPLVIGIAYLLPAEVCFSMWFFYLFFKLEVALGVQYNWLMPGPQGYGDKQFHSLQAYGGGLALAAWILWTGRRHFADVWEKATGGLRAASIDDTGELLPYRAALAGLLLAYAGIAVWLLAAQVAPVIVLTSLTTLTLALVVISWVVCQAGMLFMAQPYGSLDVLAGVFGTAPFRVHSLYTMTRWETSLFYDTREMLAPSALMGARAGEGGSGRPLLFAMAAAVLLGVAVSLYFSLQLPYFNGGGNSLKNPFMYKWSPERPLTFLGGAAGVPFKGSLTNALHLLAGFLGVLGLLLMRAHFSFGLHPIGFLCASVYAMTMLWSSIFVGWICKSLIARYGGMKGYLGAMPLFLGLILGDVVNAAVWIALGYATEVGYQIMPG